MKTLTQIGNQINLWKVPKKQWAKWNDLEQRMFNYIMTTMSDSPHLFVHPNLLDYDGDLTYHAKEWNTTAWNAAWFTADGLRFIRKNG